MKEKVVRGRNLYHRHALAHINGSKNSGIACLLSSPGPVGHLLTFRISWLKEIRNKKLKKEPNNDFPFSHSLFLNLKKEKERKMEEEIICKKSIMAEQDSVRE